MTLQDEINERITQRFIDDNPVSVQFKRFAKVSTASGGFTKGSETTLTAQTVTKINPSLRGQVLEITTEDGHVVVPDFALVAAIDANIEKDDVFVLEGKTYKVVLTDVSRDDWAKRAYVQRWNG